VFGRQGFYNGALVVFASDIIKPYQQPSQIECTYDAVASILAREELCWQSLREPGQNGHTLHRVLVRECVSAVGKELGQCDRKGSACGYYSSFL
jgi:hypothetical protein